jgi:biopolymer transport protein ExbD
MSKFKKKGSGELPKISTASLPDIVFMLLFFFMVATVLRDNTLLIQNTLPAADQVQKLDKKDRVIYIYAGKPSSRYQDNYGDQPRIQLNDKFATVADVGAYVLAERAAKREELQNVLTTALKVDGETKMGCAGPAFFTGLLYGNLDEALEFISKWEKKDLLNAYKNAPMKGLDTNLMGKDMIYWISNLLKIAEKGLEKRDFIGKSGTNETKYLEHLNKIINNKETVASHVINKFSKFQNLEDLYDK